MRQQPAAQRPAADIEIDLLGPMRLRVDATEVDVPGTRRRALLAMLAVSRGTAVSTGALITAVWGTDPPASASGTLHSHLSRVRGHLGPRAGSLLRAGAGYRLALDPLGLDAHRAEALARRARDLRPTEPRAAADQLRQALGLWRGDALAEFGDVGPLAAEAVRLGELRRALVDEFLDARLAFEPAAAVVGDAARAAAVEPWRESVHLLLVRALALDGRAAEALAAAREFRRVLDKQTGLEASPALAELERAVARGALTARGDLTAPGDLAARGDLSAPGRAAPATDGGAPGGPRAARARVPRSPTPLLGRSEELDRLAELVRADRCVTVVGPGGVGKTRLTLELVHRVAPRWADGATLVELAPVRDAATVPFALAQALRVTTRDDLLHAVIDFLSTRRQILVIDNCEHLLDAVRDLIDELLRWVPNLAVLATSRTPLGASGEWVFRLGPLPLPAPGSDPSAAAAVRLFLDRARQARGGAELRGQAVDDAAEICRGLDGLPLAIELAASRLTVLSPADLRARMDTGLDLGRARAPIADDHRHNTLRGTIAWSYHLLDPRAQRLFRYLAAVPGVFDLSVAEFVAEPGDSVADLGALVDASMVETVTAPPDGTPPAGTAPAGVPTAGTAPAGVPTAGTAPVGVLPPAGTAYRMLDSIRAFGMEAARAAGELAGAQNLIADWTAAFARSAAQALTGPDEAPWGRRLLAALPVLRAGRERMLERGDVAAAAQLSIDLDGYALWLDNAELWSWVLRTAELPALPRAAPLLFAAGSRAAWRAGSLARARELAERALASATDEAGFGAARQTLGTVELFEGAYAASIENLVAAARAEPAQAPNDLATAALAAAYGGDHERADALIREAQYLVGAETGPIARSFVGYVQAEILARTDPAAARRHAERALAQARGGGVSFVVGITLVTLASSAARTGDTAAALACYPEVIRQWLRTGSWPQQWTTLRNVAELFAALGREADALLLLTAADADPDAAAVVGEDAARIDELIARLRAHLGDAASERIRREAGRLARVEVVERALGALTALSTSGPGPPSVVA